LGLQCQYRAIDQGIGRLAVDRRFESREPAKPYSILFGHGLEDENILDCCPCEPKILVAGILKFENAG
jgi:hypothetical protein